MRTSTAGGPERVAVAVAAAALALAGACGDEGDDTPPESVLECERDPSTGPTTTLPLAVDEPVEGFICPVTDADWYELALGPDDRLVTVSLGIVGDQLSPVAPTYAIWSQVEITCTGDEGPEDEPLQCAELGLGRGTHLVPGSVVAAPDPVFVGLPEGVEATHCLQPGATYYLSVRDLDDEGFDVRRPYELEVTTAPDPDTDEPNDTIEAAIPLTSGATASGRVSCSGDQDVYAITAAPGAFLDLVLTSPVAGYEPRVEVLDPDGMLLTSQTNLRGRSDPTAIAFCRVLPEAGTFYIAIRDDDGIDSDPDVPYELTVRTDVDVDGNEPNNGPAEATALPTVSCATGGEVTITGSLGCGGDNDWFAVDVTGCARGDLLEADVVVGEGLGAAEAWELQTRVQASVTLIRPDARSPCNDDRQCDTLQRRCAEPVECAGYLEACLASAGGFCAGASVCLPGEVCGANQAVRSYRPVPVPDPVVGSPPPNQATLSAPILDRDARLYLRVSDFQADGGDPSGTYRLRVTARTDPDAQEPNNLFFNRLLEETRELTQPATASPLPACPATAVGSLGYQNDVDWWTFPKTCPEGADCPLELEMTFANGAVETAAVVISDAGRGDRFSRDLPAGFAGTLIGGPTFCGYQFRGDSGPYFVSIFDVDETPEDLELSGRDWDPDQPYTICYRAPATAGCPAPCEEVPNPSTGAMECDSP